MRAFLITIAVLLAVVILFMWWRREHVRGEGKAPGFDDYVRNPKEWSRHLQAYAESEKLVAELAEEPPEYLVSLLLDKDMIDVATRAIVVAGPDVIPHLIAALDDPRFREPNDIDDKSSVYVTLSRAGSIVVVLDCLEDYAPDEAAGPVGSLIVDDNEEIRKRAALVLGVIGSDDAVPPLRKALDDPDEYVRSYAVMGIRRALTAGRGSAGFRQSMFDAIVPLALQPREYGDRHAPICLLELDQQRAIELLTSDDALTLKNRGLHYILKALREAEVPVDESQLLLLITALEKKVLTYPHYYALGEALQLIAGSSSDEVLAAIQRNLDSPSQHVREDAAKALARSMGLTDPYAVAFDTLKERDWDGLTQPQRHVLAVRILIDEVNNGGFDQYFFNSSGNQWPSALEGLRAIGASANAELVRKAVAFFGEDGPSTDRVQRHRQLAKVARKHDEPFSHLAKEFYKDHEDREVLLLRYMIAYDADFRGDAQNGVP